MSVRRPLVTVATLSACLIGLTPTIASAQVCTGGIAPSHAGTLTTYAGGTLDLVANANAIGGRAGMTANKNNREIGLFLGARSISGGSSSILAANFGYTMDIVRKPQARVCALVDVDMVNLSDADNGYANVMFGLGFGSARKSASGSTTFLPFGIVGGNLNSTGDSEFGEFSGWLEGGFGFRMGNGVTLTPSLRQSLQTGADPVIRLLAMFPLSTKATK